MRNLSSPTSRVFIPVPLDELAKTIWQLSPGDRETLSTLLEEKFVHTVLRRAKEIPRLRKAGKLLSLKELQSEFLW